MLQGHSPQFGDFFLGFWFFFPLLLTALVGGLLTGGGWLFLIIPGVYLMVGYLFAASLVVDRRLDFWPALELSRPTVNPIWFGMFGFFLLLVLVNLLGVIALGVGLLISLPVSSCAVTAAYADLFGLQSDYSEGFPDNLALRIGNCRALTSGVERLPSDNIILHRSIRQIFLQFSYALNACLR